MVVFAPQNVTADPPFTKLDILSCRNLLIYLAPELQKRLFPLFHYCLSPGGLLFLGSAETIGSFSSLFAPADGETHIFRRLDHTGGAAIAFPPSFSSPSADRLQRAGRRAARRTQGPRPEPADSGQIASSSSASRRRR